jgi:hypothetical protein
MRIVAIRATGLASRVSWRTSAAVMARMARLSGRDFGPGVHLVVSRGQPIGHRLDGSTDGRV